MSSRVLLKKKPHYKPFAIASTTRHGEDHNSTKNQGLSTQSFLTPWKGAQRKDGHHVRSDKPSDIKRQRAKNTRRPLVETLVVMGNLLTMTMTAAKQKRIITRVFLLHCEEILSGQIRPEDIRNLLDEDIDPSDVLIKAASPLSKNLDREIYLQKSRIR